MRYVKDISKHFCPRHDDTSRPTRQYRQELHRVGPLRSREESLTFPRYDSVFRRFRRGPVHGGSVNPENQLVVNVCELEGELLPARIEVLAVASFFRPWSDSNASSAFPSRSTRAVAVPV